MTGATLAGVAQTYSYDANGNRIGVTRAGVTTAYTYDRTDQLATKKVGTGTPTSFAYDTYGNLTSSQVSASGATAYAWTAADELLSIDPPGASNTVSLTKDALGRHRVRQVNGATADTYGYLGESDLVVRLARSSNSIDSAVSASGERVAIKQGATSGWTLPDLHGSLAAMLSSSGASVTDAFRYDPYGELAASVTGGPATPWRFNGSLLLTEPGTTDLYAQGARPYDPALGVFTQLDDVMGDAQDPFSLNRYLYAWANPLGMIDPSGHYPVVYYDDGNAVGTPYPKPKAKPKPKNVPPPASPSTGNEPSHETRASENKGTRRPGSTSVQVLAQEVPVPRLARPGFNQIRLPGDEYATAMGNGCSDKGFRVFGCEPRRQDLKSGRPDDLVYGNAMDDRKHAQTRNLGNADALQVLGWLAGGLLGAGIAVRVGAALVTAAVEVGGVATAAGPVAGCVAANCFVRLRELAGASVSLSGSEPAMIPVVRPARLPQDEMAEAFHRTFGQPDVLDLRRAVGGNAVQNRFVQARIAELEAQGAREFLVNQRQRNVAGEVVGLNRPDLQYNLKVGDKWVRHYEEFDLASSHRGFEHQARIYANDQQGVVQLFWVPWRGPVDGPGVPWR